MRAQGFSRALGIGLVLCCFTTPSRSQEADDPATADVDPDAGTDAGEPDEPAAPSIAGDSAALSQAVDDAVAAATDLKGARVGILAVDLATGETLHGKDVDARFNIASCTKVVTIAAALRLLGPGFKFRTALFAERIVGSEIIGDLYVRGGGDPTLGRYDLVELADELVALGITKVRGSIAIDESIFDAQSLPPHFDEQPKEQAYFRAPTGALSVHSNAVTIMVRPNPAGAGPAFVGLIPANDYVRFVGQVQTAASGRDRVRVDTKEITGGLEFHLGGQVSASGGVRWYRRRIVDPGLYFGAAFRTALEQRGIKVARQKIVRAPVPVKARPLATHLSRPLAEIVRDLGKQSNNFVAEMLVRQIGAQAVRAAAPADGPRPATWEDGLGAVRAFLDTEVGLAPGTYRYENGSGLFGSSDLSPAQMVKVLRHAWSDYRYGPELVSSLAIAGVDGTLRRRMGKTAAAARARAKTGTLAHVATLSGYVAVDSQHAVAFAVFVEHQPKSYRAKRAARGLADKVAAAAASYLGASPRAPAR
jgi:D-alanyl-D-alanine carboxypeptidase/D-alanyl-D-alanine-endopeptidase (penicillin-binding protein 4)